MFPQRFLMRCAAALLWLVTLLCVPSTDAQPQMRQRTPEMQQQPPASQAPVPWVDVHVHLIGGRGSQQDYAGAVDVALREMDRFGITTAIVLRPPQVEAQSEYDSTAFVSALQRYPGRFAYLGGGSRLNRLLHRYADTAQVTDAVKRDFAAAAEKIIDGGAVGFGEIASLHISAAPGHPYQFVPADHPLLHVLADVAARREVPIDLHMDAVAGEMPTPSRFAGRANPATLPDTLGGLARLLAYNPQARIVWAHGGSDPLGGMTTSAIGRLMDAHANLFVSLRILGAPVHTQVPILLVDADEKLFVSLRIVGAPVPMLNKVLTEDGLDPDWQKLLIRHADRFVIGTDSFMVSPAVRSSGPVVTFAERNTPKLQATLRLLSLLSPDVARQIGRENALRLYRIKE